MTTTTQMAITPGCDERIAPEVGTGLIDISIIIVNWKSRDYIRQMSAHHGTGQQMLLV